MQISPIPVSIYTFMSNVNIEKMFLREAFEFSEVIRGEVQPHQTCVNARGHEEVLLSLWGVGEHKKTWI